MPIDMPPNCTEIAEQVGQMPPRSAGRESTRAWMERWSAKNECLRLREALWSPIADVAAQGRQVRRVTFEEGRLAFRIPAVALERAATGAVTIQISIDRPERRYVATVPPSVWTQFANRDAAARGEQPRILPPSTDGAPPPMMHCSSARLEAADRIRNWTQNLSECSTPANAPAFTYAYDLARLAAATLPECAAARDSVAAGPTPLPDQDAVSVLIRCAGRFGPRMLNDK